MGVVLTILLQDRFIFFHFHFMNPETTEATIQSVHDPVVMAEAMREDLKHIEEKARQYAEVVKSQNCVPMHDKGEVIADAMLALRHIEDARMRYGKCIQYATTGVSSFQK